MLLLEVSLVRFKCVMVTQWTHHSSLCDVSLVKWNVPLITQSTHNCSLCVVSQVKQFTVSITGVMLCWWKKNVKSSTTPVPWVSPKTHLLASHSCWIERRIDKIKAPSPWYLQPGSVYTCVNGHTITLSLVTHTVSMVTLLQVMCYHWKLVHASMTTILHDVITSHSHLCHWSLLSVSIFQVSRQM